MHIPTPISGLLCALLIIASGQPAHSDGSRPADAATPGAPACGSFFNMWEVPGVPAATLAMGGLGRELMAANDCVMKNDMPMACEHLRKLLVTADRLGPPLSEHRGEVEALMVRHDCEAYAPRAQ